MAEEYNEESNGESQPELQQLCTDLCSRVKVLTSQDEVHPLANDVLAIVNGDTRTNVKFLIDRETNGLSEILTALEYCNDELTLFALCRVLDCFINPMLNINKIRRTRRLALAGGTHHLVKTLQNVIQTAPGVHREKLIDTLVCLLLALAKKDKKFALKVRLMGLLRILSSQITADHVAKSAPLLALLAYCARSARNATFLAKQKGFLEHLMQSLQNNRLDPELLEFYCELFYFISRNKKCRPKLIGLDCVRVITALFRSTFARRQEGNYLQICEVSVGSLRQMARSKSGKEQIIGSDGLLMCEQSIKTLSAEPQAPDTCKLQSVLCALCLTCLPLRIYPINQSSPLTFKLPTDTQETKPNNSGSDSSESEDEDQLDVLEDAPDIENLSDDENQPEEEYLEDASSPMPSQLQNFDRFCIELQTGADPSAVLQDETNERGTKLSRIFGKNSENGDVKCGRSVAQVAKETKSVLKFVKLPYPDLTESYPDLPLQPMRPFPNAYRDTVVSELERFRATQQNTPKIVYDFDALMKLSQKGNPVLENDDLQRIGKKDSDCDHVKFESRFEGGNLRRATQISTYNYELFARSDVNETRLNHLWFYFELSNMEAQVTYTFELSNCIKSYSMFASGMQPVLFSVTEASAGRPGWVRAGHAVCYYKNLYSTDGKKKKGEGQAMYTARFSIVFRHAYDVCYLALHYPYTYSFLQSTLWSWRVLCESNELYCREDTLCNSLAGNPVSLLTITAPGSTEQLAQRDVIFLSARVHPAEANSSWMMHGVIKFLLSESAVAVTLRDKFIFKVIPMLNPDGVINGCSRCSLSGQDLNRQWIEPSPKLHPTIFHTKALIQYLIEANKRPLLFCDMHGHSRRCNVFVFGNNPAESWLIADQAKEQNNEFMTFPSVLSQMAPAFDLSNCRFAIQKGKEASARVVVWRRLNIIRAYTMEATYCGFDKGPYAGYQVSTKELCEMGRCFCQALLTLRERPESPPPNDESLVNVEII